MCDLGKKRLWRRDIKTPALQQINLETAKQNNYSSDNQLETCRNRKSGRNNARGIYWKLPSKTGKKEHAQLA